MRTALMVAMAGLGLAGCGQAKEAAGPGNGAAAAQAGGGAGACAGFEGEWRNERGDRLTIAPAEAGFTVTSVVEVGSEAADSDSLTARCTDGKLVGVNRMIGDIILDRAANRVDFMGRSYGRAP